MIAVYT